MPSPGRRGNQSELLKRNHRAVLLTHASATEYDVVAAEHDFHEMRLAAIAAGRSVSQATSQGPARTATTASRATSYSRAREEAATRRQLEAHVHALEKIKERASQHPLLPHVKNPAGDTVLHRAEIAKDLNDDNFAMARRIGGVAPVVPSIHRCLEEEKKRKAVGKRLRTVPDAPKKQPVLPEIARQREDAFNLDTRHVAKFPDDAFVPLPAIVDRGGHVHMTPRKPPESARKPTQQGDSDGSKTARRAPRIRVPPKSARLPVPPKAGRPTMTHVPLADMLRRNPTVKHSPEAEQQQQLVSVETEETSARDHIAAEETAAFDEAVAPAEKSEADAAQAQAARERAEVDAAEQQRELEEDEADARESEAEAEAKAWAGVVSAAGRSVTESEDAAKQRVERDRQKAKRKLEACEAEEERQREDLGREDSTGFAAIRKQWRRLMLDAEANEAQEARGKALHVFTRGALDAASPVLEASGPLELLVIPASFDAAADRPSWTSESRLFVNPGATTGFSSGRQRKAPGSPRDDDLAEPDAASASAPASAPASRRGSTVASNAASRRPSGASQASDAASHQGASPQAVPQDEPTAVAKALPAASTQHFALVHLGDGYVAVESLAAADGLRRYLVADSTGAPVMVVASQIEKSSSVTSGPHAFEVRPCSEGEPTNAFEPFHLVPRATPDGGLEAKKRDGELTLLLSAGAEGAVRFSAMLVEDADADDKRDHAAAVAEAEAAAERERQRLAEERAEAARMAVGDGVKLDGATGYELVVASDPSMRAQRVSSDERAKLRGGLRVGGALDRFFPRLRDDGYVVLEVPASDAGTPALLVTVPASKSGGLRAEVAAVEKEALSCFELVPLENAAVSEDADDVPTQQFRLKPRMHPGHIVEVQEQSEQKKLILVPDFDASTFGEFVLQTIAEGQQWQDDRDAAAAEAKAAANAKKARKREKEKLRAAARIEAAEQAIVADGALEMVLAMDSEIRIARTSADVPAKLVAGVRTDTELDQITPIIDEDGYVTLSVDGGIGDVAVVIPTKPKGALRIERLDDENRDDAAFEVLFTAAELDGTTATTANGDRFALRPFTAPDMVVEVDLDSPSKKLILVPADEASNFGEFAFVSLADARAAQKVRDDLAEAERRVALEDEAAAARTEALSELVGDPDLMTVYEVLPSEATALRLAAPEGADVGGPIVFEEYVAGSETQQFVFADVGDGYVNLVPWCSPEAVVEFHAGRAPMFTVQQGSGAQSPKSAASGAGSDGGRSAQQFEIIIKENDKFSLSPAGATDVVLSRAEDNTLVVVPIEQSGPASEFRLHIRDASASGDLLSNTVSGAGSPAGDGAARRREALEKVVGDLEALQTWELVPADIPRLRLLHHHADDGAHTDDTEGHSAVDGAQLLVRSRKGRESEQFLFLEAEAGFVHIVPFADTTMALTVDPEAKNALSFRPKTDDSIWQSFEIITAPAPDDAAPILGKTRQRFMIAPRGATGVILDVTDDDRAPLALMPDSALSPMAELVVLSVEEGAEQTMQRSIQRKQSRLDAEVAARRTAAATIFGAEFEDRSYEGVKFEGELHSAEAADRSVAVHPSAAVVGTFDGITNVPCTVEAAGAGFVAIRFAPAAVGDSPLYLQTEGSKEAASVRAGPIGDKVQNSDAAKFEVVLLESDGAFCLAPKRLPDMVVESQLNEDGRFVLVTNENASSFGELRVRGGVKKDPSLSNNADPASVDLAGVDTVDDVPDSDEGGEETAAKE